MANKKPQIKNKILEDYLISSSHDLKSVGGLVVSGIISTFGVYSLINPFFTDGEVTNTATLNTALIAFIIVLIIFDSVKRGAFTKFFNSLLKKKIIESKVKKGYLIIAVFATVFMIGLDTLGSWSTAEKGANLYSQFKTNSSTEYQILQQNAESGKATANNYSLELSAWRESKSEAYAICNDKWKGWKAKYKAKCKTEWNTDNPMPKQSTTGQIKIEDYKNIKEDNQSFLDKYLFTILFILLSLMTLLMQYLTIAKIYDDYNDIEEGLTFDRIEFINDTIQEHETILAEHEQKTAELLANSQREKKDKDRKFQEIGEAIAITHKVKRNDTRAETIKRIANNTYVPKEESKAGMVNIFSSNQQNDHQKPFNQINRLESEILAKIKEEYSDVDFVSIKSNYDNTKLIISVFFSSFKEGEGIRYFGANEKDYNKPLHPLLEKRCPTIFKILKPYLGAKEEKEEKDKLPDATIVNIINRLWKVYNKEAVHKEDKLTPKVDVININRRKEVQLLSVVYKYLTSKGYAELRGNKGYYALKGYDWIANNLHKIENDIEGSR